MLILDTFSLRLVTENLNDHYVRAESRDVLLFALFGVILIYTILKLRSLGARFCDLGRTNKISRLPPPIQWPGWMLFRLIFRPLEVLRGSKQLRGTSPVRLDLYFKDIVMNQGPSNVSALFNKKSLSAYFLHGPLLHTCFGLSRAARNTYSSDVSGPSKTPSPHSNIEPHNRLEYRAYKWHHNFLGGSGLTHINKKYHQSFVSRLGLFQAAVKKGHVQGEDLMHVFKEVLMGPAIIDAILGPALLKLQPEFLENFWMVHDNFWILASGLPRWLVPKPRAAMNRCLDAIKIWHSWARHHSDPTVHHTESDNNDEFWGSRFIRERQLFVGKVPGFVHDDIASQDLAFVWAATHNTIIGLFWLVLEVFRDPDLLCRVREEAKACLLEETEDGIPMFDVTRLLSQPYLQATYAETLRLRTHGVIVRYPREPLQFNSWDITKGSLVATCSTTAHMDSEVWSSVERGSYPVWEFAPARFLSKDSMEEQYTFSLTGLEGSWIPFGGGIWACPGRHFAKQQSIVGLAALATMFDIEILAGDMEMEMSSNRFGFGVLEPRGSTRFHIRARM